MTLINSCFHQKKELRQQWQGETVFVEGRNLEQTLSLKLRVRGHPLEAEKKHDGECWT